ncbi:MAG: DUF362 domain-containing protein [Candidatus Thorarchaeota archaeon]
MESMSEIAIGIKRSPREALQSALSKLNSPISPSKGDVHVVIKPSIYDPNLPGNTDVRMVKAIIQMFDSLGSVSIVESDNPLRTATDAFKQTGYADLETKHVELRNLSDDDLVPMTFPGHYFRNHKMPRILHENMFLINVGTFKVEPDICTVGAGIKNLFGLLPELEKNTYHDSIDGVLMDLLKTYRPDLTIIDLTEVVIGNREDRKTQSVGGVIVGTDPVAVDAFCASLIGIDPMQVDHLRIAHELGLGEALLDRIIVRGTRHQLEELNDFFKK